MYLKEKHFVSKFDHACKERNETAYVEADSQKGELRMFEKYVYIYSLTYVAHVVSLNLF